MISTAPESTRPRILFVDDERHLLDGLRRVTHSMRTEWDMSFAASGAEALALMQLGAPDVIVTDMRMPGMNGHDLLSEVKRLHPQTIRFILSGYADSETVMRVAGTAHQYLTKPCEAVALKVALARTAALRKLLDDEQLIWRVGTVDTLPSLPSMYQRIVACVQGPDPELAEVALIINSDVVMTAMVLKLANSGFFGARQAFVTVDRAVAFLGLETIAGLVLAHGIFNDFVPAVRFGFDMERLWRHSLETATGIRALARYEKWSRDRVEEAFLAGTLHDIGKLVLATRPADCRGAGVSMNAADAGTACARDSHAIAGAYLLGLWGFADTLIEAVAFHHTPSKAAAQELGLAGLLHVADRLSHQSDEGQMTLAEADLESGYLASLGLSERTRQWQAVWSAAAA